MSICVAAGRQAPCLRHRHSLPITGARVADWLDAGPEGRQRPPKNGPQHSLQPGDWFSSARPTERGWWNVAVTTPSSKTVALHCILSERSPDVDKDSRRCLTGCPLEVSSQDGLLMAAMGGSADDRPPKGSGDSGAGRLPPLPSELAGRLPSPPAKAGRS